MKKAFITFLVVAMIPGGAFADVSPAAVGWGNLFVPGLGSTLRGEPARGLVEAGVELGLFFGGTFGVREGDFTIDSTVIPTRDNRNKSYATPLIGQAMQQFGLKLHMYDTFYHYQQACLAMAESEREKANGQPLYRGDWYDVLSAPFRWKNISNPYVYLAILGAAAFLAYDYHSSGQSPKPRATDGEETLFALNNVAILPLGSAFGEEPLFRGFIQREARLYTGSLVASVAISTGLFAALHPSSQVVPAILGGVYFGFVVDHEKGDLGAATAAHFWINSLGGVLNLLAFRAAQGKWAPWAPPVGVRFMMPL